MIVYKPKADFEASIGIQNQYVDLLKTYHAELMMKTQKSKGYQASKYRVELHELSTKLDLQVSLLEEKKDHFDNQFLPSYNFELSICELEWDNVWVNACRFLKLNEGSDLSPKLKEAMDSFMDLDKENREHVEVRNVVFKDLKTLLSLVESK